MRGVWRHMSVRSVEAHECERGVEVGVWRCMSVRGVWRRMCVRGVEAYVCEGCGGVREEWSRMSGCGGKCVSEGCGGACVSEGCGLLPQETQERIL